MAEMSVYKSIIDDAFNSAVEKAVRQLVEGKIGSACDGDIKDLALETARKMVESDPEIKQAIKSRLMHWIAKQ